MANTVRNEWAKVHFVVKEGARREKSDPPTAYVMMQTSEVDAHGPGNTRFLDGMIALLSRKALTVEDAQRVADYLNEQFEAVSYTEVLDRGAGH